MRCRAAVGGSCAIHSIWAPHLGTSGGAGAGRFLQVALGLMPLWARASFMGRGHSACAGAKQEVLPDLFLAQEGWIALEVLGQHADRSATYSDLVAWPIIFELDELLKLNDRGIVWLFSGGARMPSSEGGSPHKNPTAQMMPRNSVHWRQPLPRSGSVSTSQWSEWRPGGTPLAVSNVLGRPRRSVPALVSLHLWLFLA